MTYYIETLTQKQRMNLDKPGIIDLTGKSADQVMKEYIRLVNEKKFDHLTLRHFNGWLHELISEWISSDTSPFWYTCHSGYKNFMEEIKQ